MAVDVASGILSLKTRQLTVPGKVPLVWDLEYSTAFMATPTAGFAPLWTNQYFMSLSRTAAGFEFRRADGGMQFVPDPDHTVESGHVVTNPGAFIDVFATAREYVVQKWDIDNGEVQRFRFRRSSTPGKSVTLDSLEDVTGQGLDLAWNDEHRLLSVAQRLERRSLHFQYTPEGLLESVRLRGPQGALHVVARYEYDQRERLIASYDAAGSVDRYQYDNDGRITREYARDGGVFRYRYDRQGRCVESVGLDNYDRKTLRYLDAARITEVVNSVGARRRYHWLPTGQIVREEGPLGTAETKEYDEHGRIVALKDALGNVTRYGFDDAGNRSTIVKPNGAAYSFAYNQSHLLTSVTDPNGAQWRREYDDRSRLTLVEDPEKGRYRFEYHASGQSLRIVSPLGHVMTREADFVAGRAEATDWAGNPTTFELDDFNRVVRRVNPAGGVTQVQYDALGAPTVITYPDGSTSAFVFDAIGNLRRFTNGRGETTTYRFGPCRRLLEKVDPLGRIVRFEWGTEPGRLESIQNEKSETHVFTYDLAGRVTAEEFFDSRQRTYELDATGRCIGLIGGDGARTVFTRNQDGDITEFKGEDGTGSTFDYDLTGRLIKASNNDTTLQLLRDDVGRVTREIQGDEWLESTLDASGNTIRTRSSVGETIDYEYDPNGLLSRAIAPERELTRLVRNPLGRVVEREMPGRVRLQQDFDAGGRLTNQLISRERSDAPTAARTSSMVASRSYEYDLGGALRALRSHAGARLFRYDSAERLVEIKDARDARTIYEYDESNNITRVAHHASGNGASTEERTYESGNRLSRTDTHTYEFDADGRLFTKADASPAMDGSPPWRYEWDSLGQLRTVSTPTGATWRYQYDPLGRRISKRGPGEVVKYVWHAHVVRDEIREGEATVTWIHEPHSFVPIARAERGRHSAIVVDHLGAPREIFSDAGALEWSADYSPWGLCESRHDAAWCPIRFQGQWHDAESGLHYNYFRYYDPQLGRYLSQDPIGLAAGLNIYQYGLNPVNFIDPFGLGSNSIFRRDDGHTMGEAIGQPMGAPADITTPWDHVHNKKTGQTSNFTSFSTQMPPEKFGDLAFKVATADLQPHIDAGTIRILTPDDVHAMMTAHEDPKVQKNANNTREAMKKNNEVLVEGQIPDDVDQKKCK